MTSRSSALPSTVIHVRFCGHWSNVQRLPTQIQQFTDAYGLLSTTVQKYVFLQESFSHLRFISVDNRQSTWCWCWRRRIRYAVTSGDGLRADMNCDIHGVAIKTPQMYTHLSTAEINYNRLRYFLNLAVFQLLVAHQNYTPLYSCTKCNKNVVIATKVQSQRSEVKMTA